MEKMKKQEEEANRLFAKFHNLIEDIGGELGQEAMVSILAKKCALIAVDEIIFSNPHSNPFNTDVFSTMDYWQEVKKEIEKL
ncbi:hypothetical protein UFOVP615_15 [uncultured Caudovirales phage]|uniref:Uncharacterized protein n=1 Tax=uncultured Caudovirales phage TaxID=2100421 RepID=A0A6J5N5E4_9CAUD|nr:hypothetical protein UFOVP615_15 [uncultured Caudovirales phage]